MSREVMVHGVVVGRVEHEGTKAINGRISASLRFRPDHVGIMHLGALLLDKDEPE